MKATFAFGPGIHVLGADRVGAEWVVSVSAPGDGLCPACGCRSKARHSSYWRRLRDLPMHGIPVVVRLRVARLRCREATCGQKIFAEQPAGLTEPLVQRTCQVVDILQVLGHAAGGKPAKLILSRLGLQNSDNTVLNHLKRRARARPPRASLRVVGIDDWSWTKGQTYGTVTTALTLPWSNGQTEGQISRLKTLCMEPLGWKYCELGFFRSECIACTESQAGPRAG